MKSAHMCWTEYNNTHFPCVMCVVLCDSGDKKNSQTHNYYHRRRKGVLNVGIVDPEGGVFPRISNKSSCNAVPKDFKSRRPQRTRRQIHQGALQILRLLFLPLIQHNVCIVCLPVLELFFLWSPSRGVVRFQTRNIVYCDCWCPEFLKYTHV